MSDHEETAREKLPCKCSFPKNVYSPSDDQIRDRHWEGCPALYRPAVAAALAQAEAKGEEKWLTDLRIAEATIYDKDAEISRLNAEMESVADALTVSGIKSLMAERNDLRTRLAEAERERDSWRRVTERITEQRDAAEAKGVRMGLQRAREIAGAYTGIYHAENTYGKEYQAANAVWVAIDAEIGYW